jgi:hypothetical protein
MFQEEPAGQCCLGNKGIVNVHFEIMQNELFLMLSSVVRNLIIIVWMGLN